MRVIDLRNTDLRVTSLEILEQINTFRRAENKNELRHDNLLNIIRDEFEEEINLLQIKEIKYLDSRNREYPAYKLTTNQARQILMRESKIVRKQVIKYIEQLEDKLYQLAKGQASKKLQMELMEDLSRCLPELDRKDPLNYIKANTVVNKIVSDLFGFPKMLKKFEMNPEMLVIREYVLEDYVKLYEVLEDNHEVAETLKRKHNKMMIELS
ncbi:Rha family transcriptional regulator [Cetobacterium sp.]|uniref:Rha family transcriptional regulator n=1 Tax=Cetobacterium sp. TaxID=2071632 RepID=UPI003F35F346